MARVFKTQEEMYSLIEQWSTSNTSIGAFCKAHKLSPHIFYYWRKKYQSEQISSSSFTELRKSERESKPVEGTDSNHAFKITYPNGVVLEASICVSHLKDLLIFHV